MITAPGELPVVGHLWQVLRRPREFFTSLRELDSVVRIRVGPRVGYVCTTPEGAHEVTITQLSAFGKGGPVLDNARAVIGDMVAVSNGEAHRRHHAMMLPAFHNERVASYVDSMARIAGERVGSWTPGAQLRTSRELHTLTAAMLARTVFTTEVDAAGLLSSGMHELAAEIGRRTYLPIRWLHRLPLPMNRRFQRADAALDRLTQDAIDEYRAAPRDRGDLLSMLMTAVDTDGKPMSDTDLRNELRIILLAGSTALSEVLAILFHVLAGRPDVLSRVRAEVDDALGSGAVAPEALPALAYTKRVIAEVLRMYPPAWLLTRVSYRDTTIQGHDIPAGADVYFSPYALHRDPVAFPRPDEFDPDRWLPDRAEYSRRAYIPFGNGFRKCFAESYADAVMLTIVAAVVSRWELRPVGEARIVCDLLIRLKDPVMRVEPR